MKLKYRLEKWEKALVFQVLEMDERFRSTSEEIEHTTSQGWLISSLYEPELFIDSCIELCGSKKNEDYNISNIYFKGNIERDAYFNQIQEALLQWASHWEGFNGEPTELKTNEEGVFILE